MNDRNADARLFKVDAVLKHHCDAAARIVRSFPFVDLKFLIFCFEGFFWKNSKQTLSGSISSTCRVKSACTCIHISSIRWSMPPASSVSSGVIVAQRKSRSLVPRLSNSTYLSIFLNFDLVIKLHDYDRPSTRNSLSSCGVAKSRLSIAPYEPIAQKASSLCDSTKKSAICSCWAIRAIYSVRPELRLWLVSFN